MRAPRTQGRIRRDDFRWAALIAGLLLLVALAPALAHAQGAGADTVSLAWTAPGDDGSIGRAQSYEIRFDTAPLSDATWGSASAVTGVPTPTNAGTRQKVVVRGLTRGTTYYFALKTTDDVGNVSPISNVVRWDWVFDTSPPATPGGLTAARQGTDAHLHWNPNSEPDLAGYHVYRTSTSGGSYSRVDGSTVPTNDFIDTTLPTGVSAVWYKITAVDATGNESARTSSVKLSLTGTTTASAGEWHLDPAYPNPSRGSDVVKIPVTLAGGGGSLMITDDAGRVVRRIDLSGIASGQSNVTWDGLNDASRPVVPGVYTAWLIGGGSRSSVRLLRVP